MKSEHSLLWLTKRITEPLLGQAGTLAVIDNLTPNFLQNLNTRDLIPSRIVGSRRLYDGDTLISIAGALPLIEQGMSMHVSLQRSRAAFQALLRDLCDPALIDPGPRGISLDETDQYFAVFGGSDPSGVGMFHQDAIARELRRCPSAIVLPIGRLAIDLAERTRSYLESRSGRTVRRTPLQLHA